MWKGFYVLISIRITRTRRDLKVHLIEYPLQMKDIQTLNNPLWGLYNQDLLLCSSWLRERDTIRRSAVCFRYIPITYQRGEIKTTFTVSSTNLFWAPNQAWYTHVVQPRLGRTGGFSSLEDTAPLWGISKWTDTAMLRPDLPAIPKTVFPMNT